MTLDKLDVGLSYGIALIVSTLGAGIGYMSAQSHVKVRPELANVGVIDAFLAGHGWDYLYYTHPLKTGITTIVLGTLLIGSVFYIMVFYEAY